MVWQKAMRHNGVELKDHDIKWYISDEAHSQGYARTIEKFLRGLPRCTAIVCCSYMIYLLVRQALEKIGKSIPDDYSLVCFDYSDENPDKEGVTCSITRSYEMGCELGKRLMKMIEDRACDGRNYSCVIKPIIYDGVSVKTIKWKPPTGGFHLY